MVTLRPSIEIAADVTASLALSVNGVASITPSQVRCREGNKVTGVTAFCLVNDSSQGHNPVVTVLCVPSLRRT